MNKKLFLRRCLSIALCASMMVAPLAGCSSSDSTTPAPNTKTEAATPSDSATPAAPELDSNINPTGMPIVKEPLELNFMTLKIGFQKEWSEIEMIKKYEAMSNVKINWESVSPETLKEKRNIKMASNDLPDAFMRCGFPSQDIDSYAKQGMFIRLDDMIEEYGPNIKQAFADYPEIVPNMRMSDGGIYSLPYIVAADSPRTGKFFFNTKLLEQIGKQMPTTTDELYEVLKAMKGVDLNGNGQPDEIPMSAGGNAASVEGILRGAWGLGTRGDGATPSNMVDVDPKTNKLRFIPTTPEYKELLQYISKLYQEKLLDQEIFTMDYVKLSAKGEEHRVGSFTAVNSAYMGSTYTDDYAGLPSALKGPHGDQLWNSYSSPLGSIGSFIITNQNKHPIETLRWVDFLYSEEGRRMYFMGEEGVTYEVTEDGKYEFLPIITANPGGLSYEQAQGAYIPFGGGSNPSIADNKYFKGPAMLPASAAATENMRPYFPEKVWPTLSYTAEDNEVILTIANDIETYLKENRAQFITGERSFDEWDAYVAEYENMGLSTYMEIMERTTAKYES